MVRDSNLGHQLLRPSAKWCPLFAPRTTQAAAEAKAATQTMQVLLPCKLRLPTRCIMPPHPAPASSPIAALPNSPRTALLSTRRRRSNHNCLQPRAMKVGVLSRPK